MPRTVQLVVTGLLVVMAPVLALAAPVVPDIIVPTDFPTIQAAVTAAVAGDIILVKAGVYTEVVKIDNSGQARNDIQLIGEGAKKVIVDARPNAPSGSGDGIKVQSTGVKISGLTVRNASGDGIKCDVACTLFRITSTGNDGSGADVSGGGSVTESTFMGNHGRGLKMAGAHDAVVVANFAFNNGNTAFDLAGNDLHVEDNEASVTGTGGGFKINGAGPVLIKNEASNTGGKSFEVTNGDGAHIEGNRALNSGDRCYEIEGDDVVLEKNEAEACRSDGLTVQGANPRLFANTVDNVTDGSGFVVQCLTDCTTFAVSNNKASGANGHGFDLKVQNVGAAFTGWSIAKNTAQDNGLNGFLIEGSDGGIVSNKALRNGSAGSQHGFNLKDIGGNLIENNQSISNAGDGFHAKAKTTGNTYNKNKAEKNTLNGLHLVQAGGVPPTSVATNNSAKDNGADGIRNDDQNTLFTKNSSSGNRLDCTGDIAGGATIDPASAKNKCADGTFFDTTQTSGLD